MAHRRGAALVVGSLAWGLFVHQPDTLPESMGGLWWLFFLAAALWLYPVSRSEDVPRAREPRDSTRVRFLLLAALAVGLAVFTWIDAPREAFSWWADPASHHSPSVPEVALWLGRCGVTLGVLVILVGERPGRTFPATVPPGWRRTAVGTAAGVVAVVLLTALAVPLTHYRTAVRTVASAGSEAVPVPEDVTRVGWTWEPPEHTDLLSTDAGARGPVFTVTDGLVALDGRAGEELWAYRLPNAGEVDGGVIAGGELAYVRYRNLFESGEGTVLLDTATGEVVEEGEWPEVSDPEHVLDEPVTAAGVTLRAEDPRRVDGEQTVFAYESESAEPVWEHTPEGGPEELCYGEEPLPFGDTVLLGYRCADPDLWKEEQEWEDDEGQAPESLSGPVEASVVALDARTGDELWSRDWTWEHDISRSDRVGRLAGLNLIDGRP